MCHMRREQPLKEQFLRNFFLICPIEICSILERRFVGNKWWNIGKKISGVPFLKHRQEVIKKEEKATTGNRKAFLNANAMKNLFLINNYLTVNYLFLLIVLTNINHFCIFNW